MSFSINAHVHLDEFFLSVDFSVAEGEFFTLIGPSGCGKTTTLRLIAGFIPPHSGSIMLKNSDITHSPPEKRNIGFVFQDYALFPHMNVYGNVSYGPKMKRWPKEDIESSVISHLELVHLGDFGKRNTEQLSGGEQQRIALARALAPKPDLLLLDEPLSALDANLRTRLRREIREVQRYTNLPTIYVTHDQEEALSLSDRIAIMNEGAVIQTGTPQELYRYPDNLFTAQFLGSSNIIPCRISGDYTVTTVVGEFRVDTLLPSEEPAKQLYLFFRPEACIVRGGNTHTSAPKAEAFNTLRIIPTQVEYHGAYFSGAALLASHRGISENGRGQLLPGGADSGPAGGRAVTGDSQRLREEEQIWIQFTSQNELQRGVMYTLTVPPEACRVLPG